MTKTTSAITTGIVCVCGSTDFAVIRTTATRGGILHRRRCSLCGARLTTRERPIVIGRVIPATQQSERINQLTYTGSGCVRNDTTNRTLAGRQPCAAE